MTRLIMRIICSLHCILLSITHNQVKYKMNPPVTYISRNSCHSISQLGSVTLCGTVGHILGPGSYTISGMYLITVTGLHSSFGPQTKSNFDQAGV
jgi:hypothetical protein